jgi:hypothetical protein
MYCRGRMRDGGFSGSNDMETSGIAGAACAGVSALRGAKLEVPDLKRGHETHPRQRYRMNRLGSEGMSQSHRLEGGVSWAVSFRKRDTRVPLY